MSNTKDLKESHGDIVITDHAQKRMNQRGINLELVKQILNFGKHYHAGKGCIAIFLGKRQRSFVPKQLKSLMKHTKNLALILSGDGVLVTVEHMDKIPRHWLPA